MRKLGVRVIHSSAYNPQSNGLVERGVRSLKHLLKRSDPLNQLQLHELLYCINARHQAGGSGSPLSQFLGRGVRSGIPNSLDRSINWQKLMDIRTAQQEKSVSKPGSCSKEIYELAEQVLIQNIKTKMRDQKGIISEVRVTHDGRRVSYGLEMNGHDTTRHRRYLRKFPKPEAAVPNSSFDHSTITNVSEQIQEPVSNPGGGRQQRFSRPRGRQ